MMASKYFLFVEFLVLVTSLDLITGARILGIFPVPSRSHMAMNSALLQELAKRGHQVTVASGFPLKSPIPNYTDIKVNLTMEDIVQKTGTTTAFDMTDSLYPITMMVIWYIGNIMCDRILQDEAIQKLIHSENLQFDLILMEAFINDCFIGFAHKFDAPVVQICSFVGSGWIGHMVGNPNPIAYIPDSFQGLTTKMNFWERTRNLLGEAFLQISRSLYFIPTQDAMVKKYFNYTSDMPHITDLITSSTSLILVNSHFSLNYPRPLLPNMVEVGGMHVTKPKALPNDLKKFLDDASDGVIYFSMGSAIQSADFPEPKRQAFLQVFSKLKQRVLWKWETDTLPGQPDNVKLGKWLPQSDILAHPNVRLFITHGGLLSAQETVARGVPVLGIPIFGDQRLNMATAISAGYGLLLDYNNITSDSLTWAVQEILQNPRYREKVQHLSRIYRDQPLSPLEQAVFWTEYVIRHKGAPHMRSAALDLTWYQYFLLDVIAVLVLSVCLVLFIVLQILRIVIKNVCGRKDSNKPSGILRKKNK